MVWKLYLHTDGSNWIHWKWTNFHKEETILRETKRVVIDQSTGIHMYDIFDDSLVNRIYRETSKMDIDDRGNTLSLEAQQQCRLKLYKGEVNEWSSGCIYTASLVTPLPCMLERGVTRLIYSMFTTAYMHYLHAVWIICVHNT